MTPRRQTAKALLRDLVWTIASDGLCNDADPRQGVFCCEEDGDEYQSIVMSEAFAAAMKYLGYPRPEKRDDPETPL